MPIQILLADDHKVLRDGLRAILEGKPDFTVVGEASDGLEAIKLCRALQPDVVVMDINMPSMNGIQAARQIRDNQTDIEVVVLSMHANKELIFQALEAGVKGYLLKETSGSEVGLAIQAVSQGKRYLSQEITDTLIDDYIKRRKEGAQTGPLSILSNREKEVLQLVVDGKSSPEIASTLHLSISTVSTYRSRIMKKLGIRDIPGLVRFAIENQLVSNS